MLTLRRDYLQAADAPIHGNMDTPTTPAKSQHGHRLTWGKMEGKNMPHAPLDVGTAGRQEVKYSTNGALHGEVQRGVLNDVRNVPHTLLQNKGKEFLV